VRRVFGKPQHAGSQRDTDAIRVELAGRRIRLLFPFERAGEMIDSLIAKHVPYLEPLRVRRMPEFGSYAIQHSGGEADF
jgi:hypothetical protein